MLLTPPPFFPVGGTSLINELSNLGLLTSLRLCLDTGDANSYSGSGSVWRPSSSAAETKMQIGSSGNGQTTIPNLFGIHAVAMWDRALSSAELANLFAMTRGKYGV